MELAQEDRTRDMIGHDTAFGDDAEQILVRGVSEVRFSQGT